MKNLKFNTLKQRHELFLIHQNLLKEEEQIRQNALSFVNSINNASAPTNDESVNKNIVSFKDTTLLHFVNIKKNLALASSVRIALLKKQLEQKNVQKQFLSILFAPIVGMQLKEKTVDCLISIIKQDFDELKKFTHQMFALQKEQSSLIKNTPLAVQQDKDENIDATEAFIELVFLTKHFKDNTVDTLHSQYWGNKDALTIEQKIITIIQRSQFLSINIASNENFLNTQLQTAVASKQPETDSKKEDSIEQSTASIDNVSLKQQNSNEKLNILFIQLWILALYKAIQDKHNEYLPQLVQAHLNILSKIKEDNLFVNEYLSNNAQKTTDISGIVLDYLHSNFLKQSPFNLLLLPNF